MEKVEIQTAMFFDDRGYRIKLGQQSFFECASVTTKLGIEDKPFLYRWYAELGWDQARKKLNEAGERGKRIHYAMYIYLMGGMVVYNQWQNPKYTDQQIQEFKDQNPYFMVLGNQDEMLALWKIQKFFDIVKPEIIKLEETVWHISEGIAGTLDMVLKIEKGTYDVNGAKGLIIPETGIYIGDLKTGSTVSESAWAQIAAYQKAFESLSGLKTQGGFVLHTSGSSKKGIEGLSVPLKTSEELKSDYHIFKSLSYVWDQRNPNFTLKAFEFPTIIQRVSA